MPNSLSRQQQDDICTALHVGCDRESAAKFARTTWAEVHAAMQADATFAARLRYEESLVELLHMTQLRKASEKEANWRISVWWLERLYPERYGPRGAGSIGPRELRKFMEQLGTVLIDEVHDVEDRERLVRRLEWMADTLELFLRDDVPPEESATEEVDDNGNDPFASRNGAPHFDDEDFA
jgi:hypothetical protein